MDTIFTFAQFFVVTVIMAVALKFGNQRLKAYYDGRPHLTFRRQLIKEAKISGA